MVIHVFQEYTAIRSGCNCICSILPGFLERPILFSDKTTKTEIIFKTPRENSFTYLIVGDFCSK